MANVNSSEDDVDPALSEGNESLYFASRRVAPSGAGIWNLWRSARSNPADAFGAPAELTALNTAGTDRGPYLSSDGVTLYFASDRSGGAGNLDIWRATESAPGGPFQDIVALTELNSAAEDSDPSLSHDGLTLYFVSVREGASERHIWIARRAPGGGPFGELSPLLSVVDDDYAEYDPALSFDERELFFTKRVVADGMRRLYVTRRAEPGQLFGEPVMLPINTSPEDFNPAISADGTTLTFVSSRDGGPGGYDLWQTQRSCAP